MFLFLEMFKRPFDVVVIDIGLPRERPGCGTAIKLFDPSIEGETDRFAYWFVKP